MRRPLLPILLAALAVISCAVTSCVRGDQAAGVFVDPALATLVPDDTVLMVGARIDLLVKTPVYRKYIADRKIPQIEQFGQQTGIDPEKDLWQLVYISNGRQGVLLGRGKFANDLEPELERAGMKRSGYKGFTFFGDEKSAVVFINSSSAASGDMAALHSLIDQRGKSHGPPPALAALLKEIPRQSQFWAAYTGGPFYLAIPDGNFAANAQKFLGSIESGSFYIDLSKGVSGLAMGNCSSDQSAQQVHDALQAFVGLGRLTTPSNQPDVLRIYDGIRVTQESKRVKLYVDEPEELVDKSLGLVLGKKR